MGKVLNKMKADFKKNVNQANFNTIAQNAQKAVNLYKQNEDKIWGTINKLMGLASSATEAKRQLS